MPTDEPSPIRFIRATPSDMKSIAAVEQESFSGGRLSTIALRQYLEISGPAFLTAKHSDVILGFAIGCMALPVAQKVGWLLAVAVRPGCRRAGVGVGLCKAVISNLAGEGATTILATVSPENVASLAMLRRVGLAPIARDDHYFGEGEARILVQGSTQLDESLASTSVGRPTSQ